MVYIWQVLKSHQAVNASVASYLMHITRRLNEHVFLLLPSYTIVFESSLFMLYIILYTIVSDSTLYCL